MSIKCQKSFTLTIQDGTGVQAYWTFDETTGTRMDSKNSNNFTDNSGGTQSGFVAGVQGNAVKLGKRFAPGVPIFQNSNTQLALGASGFTLAGWFRKENMIDLVPIFEMDFYDGSNVLIGSIVSRPNALQNPQLTYNQSITPLVFKNIGITSFSSSVGAFHCFRVWVDGNAGTAGVQVDNATKLEQALGFAYSPPVPVRTDISLNGNVFTDLGTNWSALDELGFWNRVLTDTEYDYIYNGGVGRTWPDVPYA